MQTRITDQPAFLIHRRDWQNSSLILDLMTRDYGRLSLLAKGGKNSRSRGLFQPFCALAVSWSGRHELKTLTAIDGQALPISEKLYLPLLYVNELIESFVPKFEANPEVFQLYSELLSQIDEDNLVCQLREFERAAMQVFGYLPDLSVDADLGRPIKADKYYLFQASRGFVDCAAARADAVPGAEIIAWNAGQYNRQAVQKIAKSVMRCIIDFNLPGQPLKSRHFYSQIRDRV